MKKILIIFLLFASVASFAQNTLSVFPPPTSGTDTYTVQITGAPSSGGLAAFNTPSPRMYFIRVVNANTGAATLNPNGLGAAPLQKLSGGTFVDLDAGDIPANSVIKISYDGTRFRMTPPEGGGAGGNFIASDGSTTLLANTTVDGDADTYSFDFDNLLDFGLSASGNVDIESTTGQVNLNTLFDAINITSGDAVNVGGTAITFEADGTARIEMSNSLVTITGGGTASIRNDPHDLTLDGGTGTISLIADNGAGQVVIDTDELIEGATTVTQTFGTLTTTATSSLVWDVASSTVEVVADAAGYALTSLNNIGHIADAGGGYNYAQSIQSSGTAINDEIFHIGVGGTRTYDLEINSSALLESTVWTDNGTGYQVSQGISASATDSDMIFTVSSPTDNITFGMDNTHIYLGANSTEWFAVYADGSISLNGDFGSAGEVIKSAGPGAPAVWATDGGGGGGTVTNIATTGPITGGPITTTGTIAITQATTSTDGYLSSTDWNTFNNKQATGLSWLLASGGTLSGANTIVGTTTNTFKLDYDALGNTVTNGAGAWLQNSTAASSGNQQISPILTFEGQGWKTNATAASQSVQVANYLLPVQGTVNPTSSLVWASNINGAGYSNLMTLSSASVLSLTTTTGAVGYRFSGNATGIGYAVGGHLNLYANDALLHRAQITSNGSLLIGSSTENATLYDVQAALTTTSGRPAIRIDGGAHTNLTASTEFIDARFNFARTVQFAAGAKTTQRSVLFEAPTYSAVGSTTITTASTVEIDRAPQAGTNVTLTNPYAFRVAAGMTHLAGGVQLTSSSTSGYVWTATDANGNGGWAAGVTLAGNNAFTGLNSFANAGTLKVSTALEVYDNTNLSSDFIGGIDKLADGFNYLKGVDHIRPSITSGASPVGVDLEVSGSDITSVSSGTGTTGSLVLQSGDASGAGNSNSGTVTIKAGTTTGTGVAGDIIILVTRTSCSGAVTGTLWNDSGTLKICP